MRILAEKSLHRPVEIDIHTHITSTADHVKNIHTNPANTVYYCLAEEQSAGRGRLGKPWVSPFGCHIYLSSSWYFCQNLNELSGLSLVVAMALTRILKAFHLPYLAIKWPNDIYCQNKKLAGILIELSAQADGFCKAVISFGMNVNKPPSLPSAIDQPWVYLQQFTHSQHDRNALIAQCILSLDQTLHQFNQQGFCSFLDEWQTQDYLYQRQIRLQQDKQHITGQGAGINQHGQLLLKTAEGEIEAHSTGSVYTP